MADLPDSFPKKREENRENTHNRRTFLGITSGLIGLATVPSAISANESSKSNTSPINPNDPVADILNNADPGDSYRLTGGVHQATQVITITSDEVTVNIPEQATLRAPAGISEGQSFISIRADGSRFRGGGTIDGNQENSNGLQSDPPNSHGHEHIIHIGHHSISRVSGFVLDGLTLKNAPGGDGIYVSKAENVRVENFTIDRAYRNGVSCINLRNATFDTFQIRNTEGVSPESGIAFEQNSAGEVIDGVTVSNGVTTDNATHGLYVNNHYTEQQAGSSTVNIEVDGVESSSNGMHGFSLHGTSGAEKIRVSGSTASENGEAGVYVGGDGNVEIADTEAIDNGQNREGDNHEVGIAADIDEGNGSPADVLVTDFTARDTSGSQKHPGTALKGSTVRVLGATVGNHTFDRDGFRAHKEGSRIEYSDISVENGPPAFGTDGGSVSSVSEE